MTCPDLRPYFRHAISRPMAHSFGVPVMSDWADKSADDPVFGVFTQCGFWTSAEAAILFHTAAWQLQGLWLDIGAHTGWTAAHLMQAGCEVDAIDPMFGNEEFWLRFRDNVRDIEGCQPEPYACTSDQFFPHLEELERSDGRKQFYQGVVIDGDHDRPAPLRDAQNAAKFLKTTGAILLHDSIGAPVQEAVEWLMEVGFNARVYLTPHVVACCWRGEFTPPEYEPEERVKRELEARLPGWMLELA